jgi:predicted PurR-regulated permease PerM
MNEKSGLLSGGWDRVMRNKRYLVWFYLLNVFMAWLGAGAFQNQVHQVLDHSLLSERLVRGFDVSVLVEMFARPEFGPTMASVGPATHFAVFFLLLTALFLPGVLQGYASTYRLPRDDFFRACGRNLWRFIRLMIVAGIAMGIAAGILFGIRPPLLKKAAESTNELLPFYVSMTSWLVIFLVMTILRIWFDLAQADVVLSDQRAVRKSIGAAFRHTWRNLGSLLGGYVLITIVAAAILAAGLWIWMKFVPATSVVGAVIVSQITLLLLLIPRFWQRGMVVTYYLQHMVEPIPVQPFTPAPPAPVVVPVVVESPVAAPVIPNVPPEPQTS